MSRAGRILLVLAVSTTLATWAAAPNAEEGRADVPRPRGDADPDAKLSRPAVEPSGSPPRGIPFDRDLFAPDLVLQNQIALGLSQEQIGDLKKLINETYARMLDLQTELQRVTEQFKGTLKPPRVDEEAALALADQMLALEVRAKKAQFAFLVRVKNLLTDTQQEKLRALRAPRREGDER